MALWKIFSFFLIHLQTNIVNGESVLGFRSVLYIEWIILLVTLWHLFYFLKMTSLCDTIRTMFKCWKKHRLLSLELQSNQYMFSIHCRQQRIFTTTVPQRILVLPPQHLKLLVFTPWHSKQSKSQYLYVNIFVLQLLMDSWFV